MCSLSQDDRLQEESAHSQLSLLVVPTLTSRTLRIHPTSRTSSSVVSLGGVASLTILPSPKALTGRSVSASGTMGGTRTYFSGSSTLEDMETFFQLLYLRMTQPRQDADAFANWRTNTIEQIKNMESNHWFHFKTRSSMRYTITILRCERAVAEIEGVDDACDADLEGAHR